MKDKTFEDWWQRFLKSPLTKTEKVYLHLFAPDSKEGKAYVKAKKEACRKAFNVGRYE